MTFVLSESAIRRTVEGPMTMRDQMRHLVELGRSLPHVSIQVLPFTARSYVAASFGFTILRFGGDASSDVVYTENFTTGDYLDRPETVKAYSRLWDDLRAAALGPAESSLLISQAADEFEKSEP
ncbi:DUF5753 domain-containing protein [Actinoplanes sp. NPDC051411]|uniref:DUF5753 domain-containing protein n=1 Tax=Actinoplanes sp. NPDC051411 TaxID=3155522 RepID=UPI003417F2CD